MLSSVSLRDMVYLASELARGASRPDGCTASITDSKILQWANEARRLNALELREYVTPRCQTLLLAMIRHARGQVLDNLTQ
jgi:ATP-dependent helicase YprA (DUF1998 family)